MRIADLYRTGSPDPVRVVHETYDRIEARGDDHVWITLRPREEVAAEAAALGPRSGPLWGVPFGLKDSLDVAGMPTTVACPAYSFVPERTAPLVSRLRAAGALLIGKTNLDQFATGLSGMRSPYGTPESPLVPGLCCGGSSSGSAVAVAAGLVPFAVGTDTAGSGRVPAVLTGTVGFKPSRGLISTIGLVPACESIDCASVFATTVADACAVLSVMAGFDASDPWSRHLPILPAEPVAAGPLRVGVPRAPEFFGDAAAAAGFDEAVSRLAGLGHTVVPVDLGPFLEAGRLLYGGPWVAERLAVFGPFIAAHPDDIHPVTRRVLATGSELTAVDAFDGLHRLQALKAETAAVWEEIDVLALPTTPTTFSRAEMSADPIGLNSTLGYYTTFANLLDLAAVAVPAGLTAIGRPHGITLLAPAGGDALLAGAAAGFLGEPCAPPAGPLLAVVGAHRSGQPLHAELLELGARPRGTALTDTAYRLYALSGPAPARPGLVRVESGGVAVEVELYEMSAEALGRLLIRTAPPLTLGTAVLGDGRSVHAFLCEAHATADAADISEHGSWPAFLASA